MNEVPFDQLLQDWTTSMSFWLNAAVLCASALGLYLGLSSLVHMFQAASEDKSGVMEGQRRVIPHMIAAIVASLICIAGVLWGGFTLIFDPVS